MWTWRIILVSWSLAAGAGSAAPPVVADAEPAPEWDAKFAGRRGWVGGDGAYSAVIGPGRVLWLFGDTLLGEVRDGGRPGAAMVNNTVAVQKGHGPRAAVRFVTGRAKDGKPAALFLPADGRGYFWPHAAARVGERLCLFLIQVEKTKDEGAFGFRPVGEWLAVIDNPDDEPETWHVKQHKLPFADFAPGRERTWGSAVLADGGHLFVYGYAERGGGLGRRKLILARVPMDRAEDFAAWRFRTPDGWGDRPGDAAGLADGLATEFSVSGLPGRKGYVAVYTENGIGDRIVGRFADAPDGPWSAPVLLYRCPEMREDRGLFCYAAKVHPWADGDGLLVSYCVNAHEFARLFRDEKVYRPKFVRVRWRPAE